MPPKGWDKNKSRKKVTSCSSARQYKHHPRKRVMRLRYSKAETLGFLAKGYNDAVEIRQHRMFRFICKKSASSLHLTHSVFSSIAQGFGDFKRKGGICACMVDLKGFVCIFALGENRCSGSWGHSPPGLPPASRIKLFESLLRRSHTKRKATSDEVAFLLVDLKGFEPSTPTMRMWCAPNCATSPCNTGHYTLIYKPCQDFPFKCFCAIMKSRLKGV